MSDAKKPRISALPTPRGFLLACFNDDSGQPCSLQESSAMGPHLWLGSDVPGVVDPVTGYNVGNRMNLSRQQVRELVRNLNGWLATGSLPRGRVSRPRRKP